MANPMFTGELHTPTLWLKPNLKPSIIPSMMYIRNLGSVCSARAPSHAHQSSGILTCSIVRGSQIGWAGRQESIANRSSIPTYRPAQNNNEPIIIQPRQLTHYPITAATTQTSLLTISPLSVITTKHNQDFINQTVEYPPVT